MDSSRVFVHGLPSNLSTEEFRKHFSNLFTVTDAKYISHRRIGYVGFKTPDEAQNAVKYYNKSFIRTSRIYVELARPFEVQAPWNSRADSTNQSQKSSLQDITPNYGAAQVRADDPKLQEFLQVMQPPSKGRTWENEDLTMNNSTIQQKGTTTGVNEDSQSEEEYQHVAKKRRISQKSLKKMESIKEGGGVKAAKELYHNVGPTIPEVNEGHKTSALSAEDIVEPVISNPDGQIMPASDVDWLRSRTNRLLGLLDDDEAAVTLHPTFDAKKVDKPISIHASPASKPEEALIAEQTIPEDPDYEKGESIVESTASLGKISNTARLFIRNLSYSVSEEDLRVYFEPFGSLDEIHIPIHGPSRVSKGFAYVQFSDAKMAKNACSELDGKPFQGRLMHILPAAAKKDNSLDEFTISKLPLKKQKQIRRKAEAASATFQWNSMYMSADAVTASISDRLGISKSDLFDPTSADSAVKQAHAETNIIQETKAFFAANGVDLEAFKKHERGDNAILVKNFAFGTTHDELRKLFENYGSISKLIMPPSGTLAIIEFEQPTGAKLAFKSLAYRKFKDSILFLEKAPKGIFDVKMAGSTRAGMEGQSITSIMGKKPSATEILDLHESPDFIATATLFVRNLNFTTSTERLREVFRPLDGFLSARVKTKPDPKRVGGILSMGFGFLEFRTKQQAQAALVAMNGYKLDGYELLIKPSQKAIDAAEERRKEGHAKKVNKQRTKIIIKNLPFEASKKDVRSLFASYGQLRSVRVPKKFDSSTRGFAFADFVTVKEAENAMDALRDTHLLGRKLVLEFAAGDAIDPEEEIEKMQRKMGNQADKVALQKLTSHGRKKFTVENEDGEHG